MQNVSKNPAREWVQKVPSNFSSPFPFFSRSPVYPKPILPLLPPACYIKCVAAAHFHMKCGPKMHDFFLKLIRCIFKVVATLSF